MSSNIRTVSASLSTEQRAHLLGRFFPRFDRVFCVQVTWAYAVPPDFTHPRQVLDLTITGHHVGDGHECLVGKLTDPHDRDFSADTRPDGKPVHITLSTAPGVPPARAGEIDPGRIVKVAPVTMRIRFHNRFASRITPTQRELLAA